MNFIVRCKGLHDSAADTIEFANRQALNLSQAGYRPIILNANLKPFTTFINGTRGDVNHKIGDMERSHFKEWGDWGGQQGWDWVGPQLPPGFEVGLTDNVCDAGDHCAWSGPAPVGFSEEGWHYAFVVDTTWVVCEDCAISIDLGELVLVDGEWERSGLVLDLTVRLK